MLPSIRDLLFRVWGSIRLLRAMEGSSSSQCRRINDIRALWGKVGDTRRFRGMARLISGRGAFEDVSAVDLCCVDKRVL
jgi:hypothetical protein